MTKLEGVKSRSRGSRRRRLRGGSLWLGLLSRLGLVSWALLVPATPSAVPSTTATSSLTITLLLFKGWLLGFCLYPINPGRFSNQYRTGADRCTPTLPR